MPKVKLKVKKKASRLHPWEELKVLRQITTIISSGMDLERILKQIVEIVIEVTKADACLLYLLDERSEELILRASKDPHPNTLGKIRMKLGEGITGWVAKEHKPVAIFKHASDDPRFKFFPNLPEDRYQSFLSVPIVHKTKTIGVINVQHKRPHQYTGNTTRLISTIACQAGGAIENARLYDEARRKAFQINNLSGISKTIISDHYLEEILNLIVTVTAKMMGSNTSREHKFTDEETRILQTIANQVAIAIENTKLTEETSTLKETLEVRKLVERAKGILMKEAHLSEDEASRLIHKKSMDTCKPMRQIAEAIIITWEMKKK